MGTAALKTWKEFRSKKPRLRGITKQSLNYKSNDGFYSPNSL